MPANLLFTPKPPVKNIICNAIEGDNILIYSSDHVMLLKENMHRIRSCDLSAQSLFYFMVRKSGWNMTARHAVDDCPFKRPLSYAVERANVEAVTALLDAKANIRSDRGMVRRLVSRLLLGIRDNVFVRWQAEMLRLLLDAKTDVSEVNKCIYECVTPAFRASVLGNEELVRILTEAKADINTPALDGLTSNVLLAAAKTTTGGHKGEPRMPGRL